MLLRYIQMCSREEVHRAAGQEALPTGLCACLQPWWHVQRGNGQHSMNYINFTAQAKANNHTNSQHFSKNSHLFRTNKTLLSFHLILTWWVSKCSLYWLCVCVCCFDCRFSAIATLDTAGVLPPMAGQSVAQQWPIRNLDAKVSKTQVFSDLQFSALGI